VCPPDRGRCLHLSCGLRVHEIARRVSVTAGSRGLRWRRVSLRKCGWLPAISHPLPTLHLASTGYRAAAMDRVLAPPTHDLPPCDKIGEDFILLLSACNEIDEEPFGGGPSGSADPRWSTTRAGPTTPMRDLANSRNARRMEATPQSRRTDQRFLQRTGQAGFRKDVQLIKAGPAACEHGDRVPSGICHNARCGSNLVIHWLRTRRCLRRRIRLGRRVRAGGLCDSPAANSFAPAGGWHVPGLESQGASHRSGGLRRHDGWRCGGWRGTRPLSPRSVGGWRWTTAMAVCNPSATNLFCEFRRVRARQRLGWRGVDAARPQGYTSLLVASTARTGFD
jgi:hypothetical protein